MTIPQLRLATEADLPAINDIYNYYVLNSTCTYQEDPEPIESRKKWFGDHVAGANDPETAPAKFPVTVAQIESQIVGWAALSPYHKRSAYRHTVENAVYVHHDFHRQGIGSMLLQDLIDRARGACHHAIIALIDAEQTGSIALHKNLGFQPAGHLKEVGRKFDKWLDVIYMQLLLNEQKDATNAQKPQ
jgi:phosphinothricin acetyltransferase